LGRAVRDTFLHCERVAQLPGLHRGIPARYADAFRNANSPNVRHAPAHRGARSTDAGFLRPVAEVLPNRGRARSPTDEAQTMRERFNVMGGREALAGRRALRKYYDHEIADIEPHITKCPVLLPASRTCPAISGQPTNPPKSSVGVTHCDALATYAACRSGFAESVYLRQLRPQARRWARPCASTRPS